MPFRESVVIVSKVSRPPVSSLTYRICHQDGLLPESGFSMGIIQRLTRTIRIVIVYFGMAFVSNNSVIFICDMSLFSLKQFSIIFSHELYKSFAS